MHSRHWQADGSFCADREARRQLEADGESGSIYAERVLRSFLTLISGARVQSRACEQADAPLLQVRYQFWLRELARVVASIDSKPRFGFAADLNRDELARSAAVVHCRECGLTGWTGTIRGGDNRLNPELDALYRAFFDNHAELAFVFPGDDPTTGQIGLPCNRLDMPIFKWIRAWPLCWGRRIVRPSRR